MRPPLNGGCQCRAIRYEIATEPVVVFACHCTACQRFSGTAFGMGLVVAPRAFRLTRGTPKSVDRIAESGNTVTAWFCPDCGVRLFSGAMDLPEDRWRNVRAGTLDNPAVLPPPVHIWTLHALPWTVIPDGAIRFEKAPPPIPELIRTMVATTGSMTA
jgi:hypothetical protein